MSIKIYVAAFILIISSKALGQSAERSPSHKRFIGRLNFTGVLDAYDQNISIGAEYRFNPQWSAGSDIAYIFRSIYVSESNQAKGIILRPFIRYYLTQSERGFLEAEIHYKYASYDLTDWLGRDATNGVPAYEEYTSFQYIKKAYGLNIKLGTDANLTRDKRLRLEAYAGIGIRFKKQGADIGTYIRERILFPDLYRPAYTTLVLPLGMRLLYTIR